MISNGWLLPNDEYIEGSHIETLLEWIADLSDSERMHTAEEEMDDNKLQNIYLSLYAKAFEKGWIRIDIGYTNIHIETLEFTSKIKDSLENFIITKNIPENFDMYIELASTYRSIFEGKVKEFFVFDKYSSLKINQAQSESKIMNLKFAFSESEWTYWENYIESFINKFIEDQKRTNPDLGSDLTLAKDGFSFVMDNIPEEVTRDSDFPQLIIELRENFIQKGIGDIFNDTLDFNNPSQMENIDNDDEGGELVDPYGNPILGESEFSETFEIPKEKESINDLLDQLILERRKGNENKIEEIKTRLDKLIHTSSLKYSFHAEVGSENLNWQSGKDSSKDLSFNYDKSRGQQINEYEPNKGDGGALSPLDMQQSWNTENLVTDNDKWEVENHSLDWQDRSNNILWV